LLWLVAAAAVVEFEMVDCHEKKKKKKKLEKWKKIVAEKTFEKVEMVVNYYSSAVVLQTFEDKKMVWMMTKKKMRMGEVLVFESP